MTAAQQLKLYKELRQVLGDFDLELIGSAKTFLDDVGATHFDDIEDRQISSGYQIRFTPFDAHKPFYRGQK